MTLSTEEKTQVVNGHKQAGGDIDSPEVQVTLLSVNISKLQDHFKANGKNHHSRRDLIYMANQCHKLLGYLKGKDVSHYTALVGRLGLRH